MQIEAVLPILAIVLSVASLVISVLNYLRDRPKVSAWAEFELHQYLSSVLDAPAPCMRIRIANLGRRPAVLLRLRLKGSHVSWGTPLKEPESSDIEPASFEVAIKRAQEHNLAQKSAVKLAEGDVLDILIGPNDRHRLMFLSADSMEDARKLYIEDCVGKLFRVRGDSRCLERSFKAWREFSRAEKAAEVQP